MLSSGNIIKEKIQQKGRGWIFFPTDFEENNSPENIRQTLSRMVKQGEILRLSQGIYYYPRSNESLGIKVIYPTMEEVAQRVAERDGVKIIPTGDYSLHKIGLSTQIPVNAVYITNGARKKISLGKGKGIIFKESNDFRIFGFISEVMMLAVSAMRTIGEKLITEEQIKHIKKIIKEIPEQEYRHDILLAPVWVRKRLQD